ncbi:hypothetical protein BU17DRAFT_57939 [Hysterangium stoloniferum]|nr:hypothetical protein BU17DRAFT_57939 [Hysterangium stoloniferum]
MANPHNTLPSPSWDETIVPTLRKRLESESRILSKRLSTISITDEGTLPDSHSTRRGVSPSKRPPTNGSTSNTAHPQRPSAIPRPSYTRERPGATTPSSQPPRVAESTPKSIPKRKRTQSTPFPFDANAARSSAVNSSDVPLPVPSSGPASRVQSPPLGRVTPTPSRIPTVTSRMRSGSQSSQGFGSIISSGKASLPPSQTFSSSDGTSLDADPPPRTLSKKKSSTSLAQKRAAEKPQPFPTGGPKEGRKEQTDRLSSDEERPFQHWYRGDVSRNGGVGEYRVGRRMEMLDIASFGHTLKMARRTRPYEEPGTHTENYVIASPRKRADSFSSVDRASIYIDTQDGVVDGRVMDETPLTDIEAETDFEQDHSGHSLDSPLSEVAQPFGQSPVFATNAPLPRSTSPVVTKTLISKSQPRTPQTGQGMTSDTYTASITTIAAKSPAAGPSNTKPSSQARGRTQTPTDDRSTATKTKTKAKTQKRSKGTVDVSRSASEPPPSELGDYTGLADAVPETRSPVARDGNWDEVILPTVARRMGIEYEKEDPAKKRVRESRIAPAPGTFGFDHSKYKPPRRSEELLMDEFGQRATETPPIKEQDSETPPLGGERPSVEFKGSGGIPRGRQETPPPFAHYGPSSAPDVVGHNRRKERQDIPQIIVRPPTGITTSPVHMEEEVHGSGCCKCIVM